MPSGIAALGADRSAWVRRVLPYEILIAQIKWLS